MAANFPILITDLNTDSGKLTETYADNNNNKPHTWTHSSEIAAHQKQRSTTKYLHKNDSSYNGSQKKKNDANYLQSEENDYQRIICSVKLVDMKLLPDLH